MGTGLQKIKKDLFFIRFNMLFDKYLKAGKITYFDENIFEKMNDTIIACLPVSLYIKHSKHLFATGTCYERSLYMFLALDDALLVRGNSKVLEYNYGKENAGHGWVEVGDYVYDPSLMLRFEKGVYYKLYGCNDVYKIDKETYLSGHKDFEDTYISHDLNEFRPNGKRRLELGVLISQLQVLSNLVKDEKFTDDLNNYLSLINYDADQIHEERQKIIQKIFDDENARLVISGNSTQI